MGVSTRGGPDVAAAVARNPQGTLRISATAEFARLFLGQLVTDFSADFPELTIELDLTPHRIDLVRDRVDLALRIGDQPDSPLISRRLGLIRTVLFAAPSYLRRAGLLEEPAALAAHRVVRNQNFPRPDMWTLTDGATSIDVDVGGSVLANNFGFARQLALLGHGIVTLHEPMVAADLVSGRLVRVLPGWWLREVPLVALTSTRLLRQRRACSSND